MHTIALVCTLILGVLVFGLGLAISSLRFKENRLSAYSGDPGNFLHRVVRAHGNATEYAPFLAVLFLYLGTHAPSSTVLWLMTGATASRVIHAIGLIAWPSIAKPNPFRFVGALGTYACGLGLCLSLIWAF
jgi:uncharacterized protein